MDDFQFFFIPQPLHFLVYFAHRHGHIEAVALDIERPVFDEGTVVVDTRLENIDAEITELAVDPPFAASWMMKPKWLIPLGRLFGRFCSNAIST